MKPSEEKDDGGGRHDNGEVLLGGVEIVATT